MGLTLDAETMYAIGRLRVETDRTINRIYRARGISAGTALDPEVQYLLDVLDATIEITNPEDA